jgi:hypothetical protein
MRLRFLVMMGTLAVLLAGSAVAVAAPVGSEARICGVKATTDDLGPAVAYNPAANQYLVAWSDGRNSATRASDIYGRLVGPDGKPVGGDFRISGAKATSAEYSPAVAYDATANQYLVVWADWRNLATRGTDIYGRRIGADGKPIGGDFRVSAYRATGHEYEPAVAYDATASQYLVVWRDTRNAATWGHDIYGLRVGADGKRIGKDFRISGAKATSSEHNPAVAFNSTVGQFLVVWEDGRDDATRGVDIYGRRVAANGTRVGGDFRVSGSNATGHEFGAAVAYNPVATQYLVSWSDTRSQATRGWDIYGRRVAANGTRVGGDFRISGKDATDWEGTPDVAYNSTANEYLVAWRDGRSSATRGWDIYGQRVGPDGKRVGGDFRISGYLATNDEDDPAVVYNPANNRYLVVWADNRDESTRGWDIYGRRVAG